MTGAIETEVLGSPSACIAAARALAGIVATFEACENAVRDAAGQAVDWRGLSGAAFEQSATLARQDLARVADLVGRLGAALLDFAGELQVAQARMAQARALAAAAGLTVAGTAVHPPDTGADPGASAAWDEAVRLARAGREKERDAHDHLGEALTALESDHVVKDLLRKLGLLPPDHPDEAAYAGWGIGLAGIGAGGITQWLTDHRYGRFVAPGAHRAGGRPSFLDRAAYAAGRDGFRARPGAERLRAGWDTTGKTLGAAGAAAGGAIEGWEQWRDDADRPDTSTPERAARAATVGTTTAGGAWAGGEAGAWVGGAIGTAVLPGVGTVVGGVAGGVIGGAAGAWAGSEVGHTTIEHGREIATAPTRLALHVADEAASELGETAGDVGKRLKLWD